MNLGTESYTSDPKVSEGSLIAYAHDFVIRGGREGVEKKGLSYASHELEDGVLGLVE